MAPTGVAREIPTEALARDWQKAEYFYAKHGVTEELLRHGVPADAVQAGAPDEAMPSFTDAMTEGRARGAAVLSRFHYGAPARRAEREAPRAPAGRSW